MRFNCGPSYEERFALKQDWHRWFAWRPVRVAPGDCRWLEYLERKGEVFRGLSYYHWAFEYREPAR
jgi:hypothetical protein